MSVRDAVLPPAAPRGRYDRRCPKTTRDALQRERLLLATALAHARGACTVSEVIALARVGRATFYEYFDDTAHALTEVQDRAATCFQQAAAPILDSDCSERDGRDALALLDGLCGAWRAAIEEAPVIFSSALVTHAALSRPASCFRDCLLGWLGRWKPDALVATRRARARASTFLLAAGAQALGLRLARARLHALDAAPTEALGTTATPKATPAAGEGTAATCVDAGTTDSVAEALDLDVAFAALAGTARRLLADG